MHFSKKLTGLYIFWTILLSVSASPVLPILPDIPNVVTADHANQTNSILALQTQNTINNSATAQPGNLSSLSSWELEWHISSTLSLDIYVGDWTLNPASIVQVLDAAENALGKKVASALVEEKFSQKTGSVMNTMVFAVTPNKKNARLKWGDVTQLLGTAGLPRFFQEEFGEAEKWRNVVFDVNDKERGKIGSGYVRKWWMVELNGGDGGNGTTLEQRSERFGNVVV